MGTFVLGMIVGYTVGAGGLLAALFMLGHDDEVDPVPPGIDVNGAR